MKKTLVLVIFLALVFTSVASSQARGSSDPMPALPDSDESVIGAERDLFVSASPAPRILSPPAGKDAFMPEKTPVPDTVPEPESEPKPLPADAPMLALTFDDGPGEITERLLEILIENDAAATFCVIGNRLSRYEDEARMIVESGSEIVGHSWSHAALTKLSAEEIAAQLLDTNAEIEEITGAAPALYRLPYGASNARVIDVSRELGLSLLGWSVDTRDWKTRDPDKIYEHIMENADEGAIILCHDLYGATAEAMERVIPELVEQGYRLVTVTELLTSGGTELEPGKLYRKAD